MALTLEEFHNRSRKKIPSKIVCAECREPILDKNFTERISGQLVHRECYYYKLGEAIELHGIGRR